MSPATGSARLDPASSLRRHFNAAIVELGAFNEFMSKIDVITFRAFWGRRKSVHVSSMSEAYQWQMRARSSSFAETSSYIYSCVQRDLLRQQQRSGCWTTSMMLCNV
jgi:hypothetical protein